MTQQIKEVKQRVEETVTEHNNQEHSLDALWMAVTVKKKHWRLAKELGCKKDSYYGWILTSTSVNGGGYDLYQKLQSVIEGCEELTMRSYQL